MNKLGIIGSSFSVGSHHNKETGLNDKALPFETWVKKYTSGLQVYNSACSGKGTELYLNKILYLKDRYDINCILIEMVNNRSMLNVKTQNEDYNVDDMKLKNSEINVYEDNLSIWEYVRSIDQPIAIDNLGSNREFNTWREFQKNIAFSENAFEFWGMLDIYQAIKLCKMLNIKVFTWQKSFEFCKYPCFNELINGVTHISFGSHTNAHNFYVDKYDENSILCDHVHFNDQINEEMVKDFIAPSLKKHLTL